MKNIDIFIGRLQPLTSGHCKVFSLAKNPVVFLMIGNPIERFNKLKPSDREKRPFITDTDLLNLYEDVLQEVGGSKFESIQTISTADIVKIQESLSDQGYLIENWFCGTDRFSTYKRMVDNYAPTIHLREIPREDEEVSATKLRKSLKDYDEKEFWKNFPKISSVLRGKWNPYQFFLDRLGIKEAILNRKVDTTQSYNWEQMKEKGFIPSKLYYYMIDDQIVEIANDIIIVHINNSFGVYLNLDKISEEYSIKKMVIKDAIWDGNINFDVIGFNKKLKLEVENETPNRIYAKTKSYKGMVHWKSGKLPIFDFYIHFVDPMDKGSIKIEENYKVFDNSIVNIRMVEKGSTELTTEYIQMLLEEFILKNQKNIPDTATVFVFKNGKTLDEYSNIPFGKLKKLIK